MQPRPLPGLQAALRRYLGSGPGRSLKKIGIEIGIGIVGIGIGIGQRVSCRRRKSFRCRERRESCLRMAVAGIEMDGWVVVRAFAVAFAVDAEMRGKEVE